MADPIRYALVTGANGGIGEAICEEFSENGYCVVATDCQPKPKPDLSCVHYLPLDLQAFVQDEILADRFLTEVKTLLKDGELHALINNAAIQVLGGVDSLTRDDWQVTLNVNLSAPFLLSQGLISELEEGQGSIINISSIHAKLTKKNFVAYATSKAALSGMTRAMAVDLGPRVRVNAIELAAVETKMLAEGFLNDDSKLAQLKMLHPCETIAKPTDISAFIVSIIHQKSKFLHGQVFPIDGAIGCLLKDLE
ncbi:MAG: SDR family NAD(P)-dependent oxidoreductase [Pseudomonadota bacterium]